MTIHKAVGILLGSLAVLVSVLADTTARGESQIRVLVEGAFPPFNYVAPDGALAGFDVDFARALCQAMAAQCEFISTPGSAIIGALLERRGDVIISSMSITDERRKLVAFTDRYYRTPIAFVAPRDFSQALTAAGLKGLRIGAGRGTTSEAYLEGHFGGDVTIETFVTQSDLDRALIERRVDLILGDSFALWRFLKSDPGQGFAATGSPLYVDDGIGIALRKEDEELRRKLNLAIARLRLDGTYEKINAKYFPFSIY